MENISLEYQKLRIQVASLHLRLLIWVATISFSAISYSLYLELPQLVLFCLFGTALIYSLIAGSWVQKIKTPNTEENARTEFFSQSSKRHKDFLNSIKQHMNWQKKQNKSGWIGEKLNAADVELPLTIFNLSIIATVLLFIGLVVIGSLVLIY